MTNKELLDFDFVDRKYERKKTNNFLINEEEIKVLTVIGKTGAGKNFFIDEIIKENENKTYITFDFKNLKYQSAYKLFLDKLNEISNGHFLKFIKDNYSNILSISSGIISTVLKFNANTVASEIFNCMLNTNAILSNLNKEQESSSKVICKYIKEISKNEDLVIVIKDFSYCDDYSINTIYQIISSTTEDKYTSVKYLISIDEDDFNCNKNNVYEFFSYKVVVFPVEIDKFNNPELFFEMLFDIFNFTAEDKASLDHVFNICDGYPGKLKKIISKIYFKKINVISSATGKIEWDADTINQIIYENGNKTDFENPLVKTIFLIVLFLEIDLTYDLLVSITNYVCQKMHMIVSENNEIEHHIQQLLYKYQLFEIEYKNMEFIIFNKNISKESYQNEFINDSFIPMLSKYLCDYLLKFRDDILIVSNNNKYYSQLAWHTFIAKYTNWEVINYNTAKQYYQDNQISLAYRILIRIKKFWVNLNVDDRFLIASCLYDSGKYDLAEIAIEDMNFKTCNYNQLLLVVKILNINMKKSNAVDLLDFMLKNLKFKSKYPEINDMKQRILSNIEDRRKEAKLIFDNLNEDFFKNHNKSYKEFLISSMEYYRGDKVQNNFDILEKFYEQSDNQIMIAELSVNRGFDLFWQGKIKKAETIFNACIDSFKRVRIHELSYVLNNYANCLMMQGLFDEAISNLRKGLMFNESKYTEIVLKTHLMVCYAIKNNNGYIKIFKELEKYVIDNKNNNNLDISIYLKVIYSLGFVQELCGNDKGADLFSINENYCSEAIKIASEHDLDTLPYIWFKDWRQDIENDILNRVNKDECMDFYNYRFEPWLLTITHD